MVVRIALAAIDPSSARKCRSPRPGYTRRSSAPAAPDKSAPKRYATRPAARQRPLPDAEIVGEEVSCRLAPRQPHREHRALARLACHSHVAAHHARELAREGK